MLNNVYDSYCYQQPYWCSDSCCHWGPGGCSWFKLPPKVMYLLPLDTMLISLIRASLIDHVDVHYLNYNPEQCWYHWSLLLLHVPVATGDCVISRLHTDSLSHVDTLGPCCHWRWCWCSWPMLLPVSMLMWLILSTSINDVAI